MMEKNLSSNESLLPQNFFTNVSVTVYSFCFFSAPPYFILIVFSITNICILLPLFIFILCHGLQKWWQMFSTSSAATMSHSDCFTYHLAIMELIGVVGSTLCLFAIYMKDVKYFGPAFFHLNFTWYGQVFFHILTCAERYLAVIHPITYMRLRNERGIRIRNASIACAWLLSCICIGLTSDEDIVVFQESSLLISALLVISFFSLSVLYVLIHPGPGENGRVDQRKQRAFCITVVILGFLTLRFTWGLLRVIMSRAQHYPCLLIACELWLTMPCSLVLPFLFLQRISKFKCFKKEKSHG